MRASLASRHDSERDPRPSPGGHFVAFGKALDPFEAQMRRMTGEEDGIVDDLFRFSEPLTGGYYFCPGVDESGFRL